MLRLLLTARLHPRQGQDRDRAGAAQERPRSPLTPSPERAPCRRGTHGLLPLMVRSSPLSSRTFECSPAAAISRTCSTTLMLRRGRGRDGTGRGRSGRDTERGTGHGAAAARRHSKMAPPRGPRAPPPAGAQGSARAARQARGGQPAPRTPRGGGNGREGRGGGRVAP